MLTILSSESMDHQTNRYKTGAITNCFCILLLSYAHPNLKRSSEVVQIGLNEADVFQTELNTATLGPDQGLFFILYEDDLE